METMKTEYDTIVIGGGQAGLATGYYLQQAGLRFLILEAGPEPVGSWPNFYDSVLLNTPARYSALPGLPFPGEADRYPARDEVVAYLRRYAAHFKLPIKTGARVSKVERLGRLFRVVTAGQGHFLARTVVAATGFFGRPHRPDLPGQTKYRGQRLHAADYHRPEPFEGQRIVVVGGANAAIQIGIELADVAQVTLATREPIRYRSQRLLGRDIHFWLAKTGLDRTQWLGDRTTPVFDGGRYQAAIAAGQPDRRPMFRRFTAEGVVWSDGAHEAVDAVIFATGYRPHLSYLAGLGALDQAGQAHHRRGVSNSVPGLYYTGLSRQQNAASGTLRGAGMDAKFIVAQLKRYHQAQERERNSGPAHPQPVWLARSNELLVLISLILFALKGQLAGAWAAAPKLVGEALVRLLILGVGSLGYGQAAGLYSR